MGIITTIICGAIIGVVAKYLMPGKNDPQGFILTAILGIVGMYIGGLIPIGGGDLMWWIKSIVGALVLLFVYQMVMQNRTTA